MQDLVNPQQTPQTIYIAGFDRGNDLSLLMLVMMEMSIAHAGKAVVFRPVIENSPGNDHLINFVSKRYGPEIPIDAMYGCTSGQVHEYLANQQYDELLKHILAKYKALKALCPSVICVGSDYLAGDSIYEFEFNLDIANNLDALLLAVIQGANRDETQLESLLGSVRYTLKQYRSNVLALVITGLASQAAGFNCLIPHQADYPLYCLPPEASFDKPSIHNIIQALRPEILSATRATLAREVLNYKIASMQTADFLPAIADGDLVISASDRADIMLASLISYQADAHPKIAGLLLTGSAPVSRTVMDLLNGLGSLPFALLRVADDTFSTALAVSEINAELDWQDERKIAAALGFMEKHINLVELRLRLFRSVAHRMTPLMFEYDILQRAKQQKKHIVLPEGEEERILRAAEILRLRDVVDITLLGNRAAIEQKIQKLSLKLDQVAIIDPLDSPWRRLFADYYFQARQHKGVVYDTAFDLMADVSYFGTLMVQLGYADGMVSGAVHSTQHTIRPAFEIIKNKPDAEVVSSVFFMCLENQVLVYGDCAVNPDPDAEQLADIAINAADTAALFNIEPKVAMLSYSTGDSGKGEAVDKVRAAVAIARQRRPHLKLEGPIQYDAAVDPVVAKTKLSASDVAGQATVFIFPDLNTGNNTYKAVQRSSDAIAIGPVLQGLNKPVNDLSRGCTVPDIVNTVIITAIQAQEHH